MTKYSKAVAQMRKEGIDAFTKSNGGVFIRAVSDKYFELELSLSEVQKWADLYDADKERGDARDIAFEIVEQLLGEYPSLAENVFLLEDVITHIIKKHIQ